MKKNNKFNINPDRLIKKEELINLKGGNEPIYPSYRCYMRLSYGGGCEEFRGYINTASCFMAYELCYDLMGGGCVTGGECGT